MGGGGTENPSGTGDVEGMPSVAGGDKEVRANSQIGYKITLCPTAVRGWKNALPATVSASCRPRGG